MFNFDCYPMALFAQNLAPTHHSHISLHFILIFSSAYNSLGTDAPKSDVGVIEEVSDDAGEPELQEHQGKHLCILILSILGNELWVELVMIYVYCSHMIVSLSG